MNSEDSSMSDRCIEIVANLGKDPAGSFAELSKETGDSGCRYLRGLMLLTGTGVAADRDAGLAEIGAAAEMGFGPASIVLSEQESGKDVSEVTALRMRAESHDTDACRKIFPLYDTGKNPDGSRAVVKKDHAEAVRLYAPCIEEGDVEAEETIGYMYLMGKGVDKDQSIAVSLLTAAAEGGSARAAYRLGYMYDTGQCYIDPNLDKAVEWYEKAADMGYAEADYMLSGIYFMKDSKWYDRKSAQEHILRGAERGCPDAEHQLGLMYAYGANGFKRDIDKAKKYLLLACGHGVQQAQLDYANMCFEGTCLPRDMDEAAKWFEVAAAGFSGTAMYALGCMYANGYHYQPDEKKAAEYFTEAAEGGEVNAEYALACFYYEGRGLEKDVRKASTWFREAAEQGHPGAMAFLGMFMITGKEMEQDVEGGLAYLKKAADGGYYEAQFYLGKLYAEGEYVARDMSYAKKMLKLAAEQGDPDAAAMLDAIKKKKFP